MQVSCKTQINHGSSLRPLYFKKMMSPIIWWMKVFGIYHESDENSQDANGGIKMDSKPLERRHSMERWQQQTLAHQAWSDIEDDKNHISNIKPENSGVSDYRTETVKNYPQKESSQKDDSRLVPCLIRIMSFTIPKLSWFTSKLYCMIVTIFLYAAIIQRVAVFVDKAVETVVPPSMSVSAFLWFSQNALFSSIMFYSCYKKSHLRLFYRQWEDLLEDAVSENFTPVDCQRLVRRITFISVISFMTSVVGMSVITMALGFEFEGLIVRQLLLLPLPDVWWSVTILAGQYIFTFSTWMLSQAFIICLALVLSRNFNHLASVIQIKIAKSEREIPQNIANLRKLHLRMCNAVATLNRFFRIYLAANLIMSLASATFDFYMVVTMSADAGMIAVMLGTFCLNAASTVTISIIMALLHQAAHSPLRELFTIEGSQADTSKSLQMQLFVSQLTCEPIGATFLDLFVITKEVLLTILGAFITYFFLILQFNI